MPGQLLVTYCIDLFEADHYLFESNFLPDKVYFSYQSGRWCRSLTGRIRALATSATSSNPTIRNMVGLYSPAPGMLKMSMDAA